jgi:hypothetical protein
MANSDKREPAVYVNIEDKSYIGPPTETGRVVFGVILCDRGPDNRVVTITSQKEYQSNFGAPDIRKCSQTHYMLNKALEYTGKVLAVRVMPSNATIANTCLTAISTSLSISGGTSYTFTNNLYNQYGDLYFSKDSETSLVLGLGEKTLTTDSGLSSDLHTGDSIKIIRQLTSDPFKDYLTYMIGTLTSYDNDTGELVIEVTEYEGEGTYDFWSVTLTDEFESDYIYGAMTCSLDDMQHLTVGSWVHSAVDNESFSRQIVSLTAEASGVAGGGCCGDDLPVDDGDYFCLALLDQIYTGTEGTANACLFTPFATSHVENITSPDNISEIDDFVYHFYANGAGEFYNDLSIKCTRNYEMEKMFTDEEGQPYYPYIFVDFYLYHTDENGTASLVEGPWTVSLVRRTPNGELIRDYQGGLPTFIEDVINTSSIYIRVKAGSQIDDLAMPGAEDKRLQLMLALVRESVIGTTNIGDDGIIFAEGDSGTGLYDAGGNISVSNLVNGRVANAYSGSLTSHDGTIETLPEAIYPFFEPDYVVTGGFPISSQYAGARLAASREDCFHLADTGMNYNNYMYDIQARQQTAAWNYWTSALYVQYRRMFDDYTGRSFWMSPVYHALEAHLRTDNNYFLAEPPCNIEKGAIGDAVQLAYQTNHTIRGDLFDKELNYTISEANGVYFAIQFTTWKRFSALKRQHIAKFVTYLKRKIPIIMRDIIQRKATQYWLAQAQYRINNFFLKYLDGASTDKYACINSFTAEVEFDTSRSELNVYVTFVPILAIERINVFLTIPTNL